MDTLADSRLLCELSQDQRAVGDDLSRARCLDYFAAELKSDANTLLEQLASDAGLQVVRPVDKVFESIRK